MRMPLRFKLILQFSPSLERATPPVMRPYIHSNYFSYLILAYVRPVFCSVTYNMNCGAVKSIL